jgi:precorrin-6Y C5,15-methyltransferase (decarboxylating)
MTPAGRPPIVVVGIGADGWAGLSEAVRAHIRGAEVMLGGSRQLALLPPVDGQLRETWPTPLRPALSELVERHRGRTVVALGSGDPLQSGIGSTLIELLGHESVEVVPTVSSVALARARMGWPAETTGLVGLVGRDASLLRRELAPGRRLLVLSSDETTPARVAALLRDYGYDGSVMTVLGDLGSAEESRVVGTAGSWSAEVSRLHVLALELAGPVVGSWTPGLPDSAYEHDGQLTKRDLRASALARLAPQPGQLLWDVGAGAGSVGIEWMRAHPTCRAVAVEADHERTSRVARNAASLGVPGLTVVEGQAPEALGNLPSPDAVFVGGGATRPGVLETCLEALRPGGRLVVHGVTVETEALLGQAYGEHGGELTRIAVETAAPIGTFTGWTPARAVTQWSLTKEPE